MTRLRMYITLEGPTGACKKRVLDTLRDAGYTVDELPSKTGSTVVVKAVVLAPYGEVTS